MLERFIITNIDRIILVGESEYPEIESTFPNTLQSYELIYKISGKTTVYFNCKTYDIQGGTVYILPKGNTTNYSVKRIERGKCIDVFFQCDKELISEVFVKNVNKNEKIKELFNKAFSVWVAKNSGYYLRCVSLIYNIFYELNKNMYISQDKILKIKPALDYINNNFTDTNIQCESLAQKCGISYSYLKKLFLQQFNLTPNKYILRMRINYACDLLQKDDLTITQIASISGFSDVFYFCRFFKKSVGVTPTQFQKKYTSSK